MPIMQMREIIGYPADSATLAVICCGICGMRGGLFLG
jgi:hypothetical protein